MGEEERLRRDLVDDLVARGAISESRVEKAFRAVGRHHFLPGRPLTEIYSDSALPTHHASDGTALSSSSQPAIMAVMLQQLGLSAGQRVLEVGAGTGYNAALLADLVGPEGRVVSVDIDPGIATEARAGLQRASVGNVEVAAGDGAAGWPDAAPYDRVIATCSSDEVPEAWVGQLAPGGRIVLPLELRPSVMFTVALERDGDCLQSVSASPCGFMRIRGSMATGRAQPMRLASGVSLDAGALPADPERIAEWLRTPTASAPVPGTGGGDAFSGFRLWLSLTDPGACTLALPPELVQDRAWPAVWRSPAGALTWGVLADDGICLLDREGDGAGAVGAGGAGPGAGAVLRSYGGPSAAERYERAGASWRAAGEPGRGGVRVTICPAGVPVAPVPGAHVLSRRWSNIVVELV
jgi:protein-L-isoaspartate(D-aspartate) O-methyltransferase